MCTEGKVIAHCIDGNHSTRPGDEVRTIVSWWCVRHQRVVTWVYEGLLHPFPTPILDKDPGMVELYVRAPIRDEEQT